MNKKNFVVSVSIIALGALMVIIGLSTRVAADTPGPWTSQTSFTMDYLGVQYPSTELEVNTTVSRLNSTHFLMSNEVSMGGYPPGIGYHNSELSTRLINNASSGLNNNTHDTFWIFTDVALNDNVSIGAPVEGDRSHKITGTETIVTVIGSLECWKLEHPATNSAWWYEKTTGLCIAFDYWFGGMTYHQAVILIATTYPFDFGNGNGTNDVPGYLTSLLIMISATTVVGIAIKRLRQVKKLNE
ncbi:MAG: hypothetical protein ACFFCS_14625 [Candidatus Hodarchaeota archaeon]